MQPASRKIMKQVELKSGETFLICWVDKPVSIGDMVTLKAFEDDRWWEVVGVYKDEQLFRINRDWKVGGL